MLATWRKHLGLLSDSPIVSNDFQSEVRIACLGVAFGDFATRINIRMPITVFMLNIEHLAHDRNPLSGKLLAGLYAYRTGVAAWIAAATSLPVRHRSVPTRLTLKPARPRANATS